VDSVVSRPRARVFRRAVAIAATAALALGASVLTTTSASAAVGDRAISGASITWGLNGESGGGAFFGGCNFLSAGVAGDTGSSRLWTQADDFYSTQAGNVEVLKPNSAGVLNQPTWATKCQTPAGTPVTASSATSLTNNVVKIGNGTGTKAADGSTTIDWTGSFSVVFYGGLTYWSVTDPTLTLDAAGNGQLTGTASGYGTSMEDMTQWVPIAPEEIVLADISGATVSDTGLSVTPDYLGVTVELGADSTPQSTTGATSGSFPQSFVDFQVKTGQSSYWYSSGGSRDAAKPSTPLAVAYTVAAVTPEEPAEPAAPGEQDLEVIVPEKTTPPVAGSFGWTFDNAAAVSLGTAVQTGSSFTATGTLNTVSVTDTRTGGTLPYSWSISGQVSSFTAGSNSFGANYLGWTPTVKNAGTGVSAGAAVTSSVSGGAGLATSATLASSTAAASADIDTALSLVIPDTTAAGNYTSTLTVTALG